MITDCKAAASTQTAVYVYKNLWLEGRSGKIYTAMFGIYCLVWNCLVEYSIQSVLIHCIPLQHDVQESIDQHDTFLPRTVSQSENVQRSLLDHKAVTDNFQGTALWGICSMLTTACSGDCIAMDVTIHTPW